MVILYVLRTLWRVLDRRGRLAFAGLVIPLFVGGVFDMTAMLVIFGFLSGLSPNHAGHRGGHLGHLLERLAGGTIPQERYVFWAGSGVIAFILLKNLWTTLAQFAINRFLMKLTLRVSTRLFDGYLRAPYEELLPRSLATAQRRLQLVPEVYSACFNAVALILADGMTLVIFVVMLSWVHPALTALAVVVFGGVGSALYWGMERSLTIMGREEQEGRRAATHEVSEAFGGLVDVRLRNARKKYVSGYEKALGRTTVMTRRKSALRRAPRSVNEVLLTVLVVGAVFIVTWSGGSVKEALPTLGLFGFAGFRVTNSVSRFNSSLQELRQKFEQMNEVNDTLALVVPEVVGRVSGKRLGAYYEHEKPVPAGRKLSLQREISLENVTFRAGKPRTNIVDRVNLKIERGSFTSFCGPSGGGKTTLLRLLVGLYRPSEGVIRCDDWDIWEHIRPWHANVGYVAQNLFIADGTVRENVALGFAPSEVDDTRVWSALEMAAAAEFVKKLPEGLDTQLKGGDSISGGQRQRIVIARALYGNPELLVFDEATAALDNMTEFEVSSAIQSLSGSRTIICVAHRLSTIRRSDVIHYVDQGRVLASGTYEELLEQFQPFRAMVQASESKTYQSNVQSVS